MTMQIEGLEEALKKMDKSLYAAPLRAFFERAATALENAYRTKASEGVDTGRGRASITHVLDSGEPPEWAAVGTNVLYMAYQESGTGLLAQGEPRKGGRHWPPAAALDTWAIRHGFESGAQVARIIGLRGGLRPRWWLRDAFEESLGVVERFVGQFLDEIGGKWSG
jgi:hypothetical protein